MKKEWIKRAMEGGGSVMRSGAAVVTLLVLFAGQVHAVTQSQLYEVLQDKGIVFDADEVRASVIDGMLKAVDPRAQLLTAQAAEALSQRESVEEAEAWPEGIFYLKLRGVYKDAGAQVASSLENWSATNSTGVVIDLRHAQGNSLGAVDTLAGMFVGTNALLYRVEDSSNQVVRVHHSATNVTPVLRLPVILVVDRETGAASEVLAAALKSRGGVLLIGTRTRGDQGLRELIPLSDAEVLYVATRRVIPADGVSFASVGVEPDIELSESGSKALGDFPSQGVEGRPLSEKARQDVELFRRVGDDAALCRAIDVLFGLKALGVQRRPLPPVQRSAGLSPQDDEADMPLPPPPEPAP